jgi:tetratricopeptide (TPR) repeat protein
VKTFLFLILIAAGMNGFALNSSVLGSVAKADDDVVQHRGFRQLLLEKKYSELSTKINDLQARYEAEFMNEDKLTSAVYCFEVNDASIQPILDEWASNNKSNFAALLCRGAYFLTRAAHARGADYAAETNSSQFQSMESYLRRATSDLRAAIQLKPASIHAYAFLIRSASLMGDLELQRQLYNSAIKINPHSILIRQVHIAKLAPRWGGSKAEMQAVVDDSKKYLVNVPAMKIVESELDIELGMQSLEQKDYDGVIQNMTKALTRGNSAIAFYRRGQGYMYSGDLLKAVTDFRSAIEINPSYINALEDKVHCYLKLQVFPAALRDLNRLLDLSPDSKYFFTRGLVLGWYSPGQSGKAAKDLEEAVRLDPANKQYAEYLAKYRKEHVE